MERLASLGELTRLRDRLKADTDPSIPTIVIPAGACGQASGANDLIRVTKRELLARGLLDRVKLRITGCHGFCQMEPSLLVEPAGTFYPRVGVGDLPKIVEATAAGHVLTHLLFVDPESGAPIARQADLPFFKGQQRTILSANERLDPIRIYTSIENGGYEAFARVLERGSPSWVIDQVKASGLRGRGGAGFPTGVKWAALAARDGSRGKYLVCNADEGDPGAYMDRSVLEGNPHGVIEGMLIGAYATGATEGIIYVRNEYPLAIKHLVIALRQARDLGLLGTNILGTGFSFDIRIVRGAGAFVCGEETALIRSIEGRMGEPRQRPPFPVQKGIRGQPTAINNVETWANVPVLLRMGAEEYAKTGTERSRGTKIFSLVGKVKNTGLVEVPMGTTIGEIVHAIGGGPSGTSRIKAVQTGGPSGGCIPASMFHLPIDYDSLAAAGSIMGSGGMIVMDGHTCMVDVAKYYMAFLKDESCGKCFTCRKGTQRMWEILDDISKGKGTLEQLDLLEELAVVVRDASMCGLGQTAPNPVLSTLRYFRDEYVAHIRDHRCPAGVCRDLVGAPCQSACPLGTEAWRYVAHIGRGEYEEAYKVIREANPFPSICARVCNHPCEDHCRAGSSGGQAVAIRLLKRFVTDRIDPLSYRVPTPDAPADAPNVAVVGSGPAGLTAAHYLSRKGYRVTVYEAEAEPGGMMLAAIPAYRLPREVIRREIASLLDRNIEMRCNQALGRDFSVDSLLASGYAAVFLALGAHKSLKLNIPGEDTEGVIPSIRYLKDFNLRGQSLARGDVGVVGGGNSAVDAARVAIRQKDVKSVTLFYRRTREEMPAFGEEIEAALQEGVRLETLVSPSFVLSESGRIAGVEFVRNRLAAPDASGRRSPIPIPDSNFLARLDTLIVAISEGSDTDCITVADENRVDVGFDGRIKVDPLTLCTSRRGVFAGGDVVTGPNTVVDAIAAGRKAADVIDRYLHDETLFRPAEPRLPEVYVEPLAVSSPPGAKRADTPRAPVEWRKRGFAEVEMSLSVEEAKAEALRCLRCDLEFTRPCACHDTANAGGEPA